MRAAMKTLGRCGLPIAAILSVSALTTPAAATAQTALHPEVAALAKLPVVDSSSLRRFVSNLAGKSGRLLARFVLPAHSLTVPPLAHNLNYTSKLIPTVQEIAGASNFGKFSLITMKSFGEKIAGSVGTYRVGYWPEEKGRLRSEAYDNPDLVGGVGLYHSSGPRGPFAHIDVRGSRARWVRGGQVASRHHKSKSHKSTRTASRSSKRNSSD